jgi:hypothetical protein
MKKGGTCTDSVSHPAWPLAKLGRLLHLPLKSEFYYAIADGSKKEEYRLRNSYWMKRIEGKEFDGLDLSLGYPPADDATRRIWRPWRGYEIKRIQHPLFGPEPVEVYVIRVNE